jgi:hypothetical protein
MEPEPFKAADSPQFEPDEERLAEQALGDVNQFWGSLGLKFPFDALMERL